MTQPWWSEVKRQTVEWYPSRAEAEREEDEAIKSENPKYNKAGTGPRRWVMTDHGYPAAWTRPTEAEEKVLRLEARLRELGEDVPA